MFLNIFESLNKLKPKIKNKKIILFGAGSGGKNALEILLQLKIKPSYFVDNKILIDHEGLYNGYKISNPYILNIENKDNIAILIASRYDNEISKQLTEMGFSPNKHFFSILFNSKDEQTREEKNIISGKNVYIAKYVFVGTNIKFGNNTYVLENSYIGNDTILGKYCSISANVAIAPGTHYKNILSTSPSLYPKYKDGKIVKIKGQVNFYLNTETEDFNTTPKTSTKKYCTVIGNDVWIGRNAVIMNNIKVGDGAIIGAGAIVTHDVKPYSIVAGVPAKSIGYRFSKETIKKLLQLKWWDIKEDLLNDLPSDINKCIDLLKIIKGSDI